MRSQGCKALTVRLREITHLGIPKKLLVCLGEIVAHLVVVDAL
jgi:hypothetical protein